MDRYCDVPYTDCAEQTYGHDAHRYPILNGDEQAKDRMGIPVLN